MKTGRLILTAEGLQAQLDKWRSSGLSIVFTNGVFDILHLGHVDYLEAAARLGDCLVVGINSDASVRRLGKGPERPINPEVARAGVVAGLKSVAATIVFDQDTPAALIAAIRPDVLVKGGDYDPDEADPDSKKFMVGAAEVRAAGGKAICIPLTEGFSTTGVVKKLTGKG